MQEKVDDLYVHKDRIIDMKIWYILQHNIYDKLMMVPYSSLKNSAESSAWLCVHKVFVPSIYLIRQNATLEIHHLPGDIFLTLKSSVHNIQGRNGWLELF